MSASPPPVRTPNDGQTSSTATGPPPQPRNTPRTLIFASFGPPMPWADTPRTRDPPGPAYPVGMSQGIGQYQGSGPATSSGSRASRQSSQAGQARSATGAGAQRGGDGGPLVWDEATRFGRYPLIVETPVELREMQGGREMRGSDSAYIQGKQRGFGQAQRMTGRPEPGQPQPYSGPLPPPPALQYQHQQQFAAPTTGASRSQRVPRHHDLECSAATISSYGESQPGTSLRTMQPPSTAKPEAKHVSVESSKSGVEWNASASKSSRTGASNPESAETSLRSETPALAREGNTGGIIYGPFSEHGIDPNDVGVSDEPYHFIASSHIVVPFRVAPAL
ncbi:hypothetical protein BDK51DRAFT_47724 [Blyttiomyces helicus]|uniref:Uncharacterized protein n=1 Tax=Blyttiomyces helicus TaxID=388810 RepID=A0A4P9W4Q4_9FUNG|nr:hypothetical protein BDK51DRAFT_47724 [Blyttiomyces helicus]|eukprot:RKO85690.1 hypothetical protein BDK51DRAFT_47724 [Blyttiomyces helicus]